jgi:hypothetical protein
MIDPGRQIAVTEAVSRGSEALAKSSPRDAAVEYCDAFAGLPPVAS